jgi:hypothetical protein
MSRRTIEINRAPVFTLWGAIVAQRLGHPRNEALTLGKAVAGLNAQSKGQRLGIYPKPAPGEKAAKEIGKPAKPAAANVVVLMHRHVPVKATKDGLRALAGTAAIDPAGVERYLEQKFGEDLEAVTAALTALAKSRTKAELETEAYALYEKFRPAIPEGVRGWGAKGVLDLGLVRKLAEPR